MSAPPRPILAREHAALRQRAAPVPDGYPLAALLDELALAMRYPRGVGLAAPQIGEMVRALVVAVPHGRGILNVQLADPVIYWRERSRPVAGWEGCLSYPRGWRALVPRSRRIKVRGRGRDGEPVQFGVEGFAARVVAHEIDHLDGVLVEDRALRIDDRRIDADD